MVVVAVTVPVVIGLPLLQFGEQSLGEVGQSSRSHSPAGPRFTARSRARRRGTGGRGGIATGTNREDLAGVEDPESNDVGVIAKRVRVGRGSRVQPRVADEFPHILAPCPPKAEGDRPTRVQDNPRWEFQDGHHVTGVAGTDRWQVRGRVERVAGRAGVGHDRRQWVATGHSYPTEQGLRFT